MKVKIILFLLTFLVSQSFAQKKGKVKLPYDSTTLKYTYTRIINVPGKDSLTLYKMAKEWYSQKYPGVNFQADQENQHLGGMGSFLINVVLGSKRNGIKEVLKVLFRMDFYFKNGRCKLEITDILIAPTEGNTAPYPSEKLVEEKSGMGHKAYNRWVNDILMDIDKNITSILNEIDDALNGVAKNKSDW